MGNCYSQETEVPPTNPIAEKTIQLKWRMNKLNSDNAEEAVEITLMALPEEATLTMKLPKAADLNDIRGMVFLTLEAESNVATPEGTTLEDLDCMSELYFGGAELNEDDWDDIEDGATISVSIDATEIKERINQRILFQKRQALVRSASGETWREGATPECVAARNNDAVALSFLIENCGDVNQATATGETPVTIAARHGSTEALTLLLDANADPSHEIRGENNPESGKFPLYIASERNAFQAAELLISHKAEVDRRYHRDAKTPTSLFAATRNDCREVLEILLAHDADVHQEIAGGKTPIYVAAESDRSGAIQALLEAKAEINGRTHTGMSPVCGAATFANMRAMQVLLDAKGDPNQGNGWATPLMIARKNKTQDCTALLIQYGARAR